MELRTVECELVSRTTNDRDWPSSIWVIRETPIGKSVEWSHPAISRTLACAMLILQENARTFSIPVGFFSLGVDDQHALLRVFAVSAVLDDELLSAALKICEADGFQHRGG